MSYHKWINFKIHLADDFFENPSVNNSHNQMRWLVKWNPIRGYISGPWSIGISKFDTMSIFFAWIDCEAGDEGCGCRAPLLSIIGSLLEPGVMTIGRPFISSAYLNPTATAKGLFRCGPTTTPSYDPVRFILRSAVCIDWVSARSLPFPKESVFDNSLARRCEIHPPGNKPSDPQQVTWRM